ncbi:unnamed protein product [Tilletia caries]|uniref:Uncharacterized protein n=1 Tax=Tilletia caries TaxID=13290 RepID=A0ABN7IP83_9BASI|nr:unnamed protein product [Tilletia caries]
MSPADSSQACWGSEPAFRLAFRGPSGPGLFFRWLSWCSPWPPESWSCLLAHSLKTSDGRSIMKLTTKEMCSFKTGQITLPPPTIQHPIVFAVLRRVSHQLTLSFGITNYQHCPPLESRQQLHAPK